MSQYYEMSVEIRGYDPLRVSAIKDAADAEWAFDDWYEAKPPAKPCISAHSRSNLCGGESEAEFARRLGSAIWKANNDYCEVTVHATYLEDQPFETYTSDEEDFDEWVRQRNGGTTDADQD